MAEFIHVSTKNGAALTMGIINDAVHGKHKKNSRLAKNPIQELPGMGNYLENND